jgi:acyl carrier protein
MTDAESDFVREKVRTILVQHSADQTLSVTRDTALVNDLGYHSLAMLEAIFALEDEIGIELIDDGTASSIVTVGDVEDRIVAILEEAAR